MAAAIRREMLRDGQIFYVHNRIQSIDRTVQKLRQLVGDVDRILVDCGPGSFTGVRIGVSAANALGLAWRAEVAGYQCLSLVAAQARQEFGSGTPICVSMIGGHGEFFVQNFDDEGQALDDVASLKPDDAASYAKCKTFAGSAAEELAALIGSAKPLNILPNAASIGLLPDGMTGLAAKPIYGRKPDAEPAKALQS